MRRGVTEILIDLKQSLGEMIDQLKLDQQQPWSPHFEQFMARANALNTEFPDEALLRELCYSIISLYSGKSRFSEYAPIIFESKTSRYAVIPGTEDYERIANRLYEICEEIRTVGSY